MGKKHDNAPKNIDKISDPLVKKFYTWAGNLAARKVNQPLVFINFLRSDESPVPLQARGFFSAPLQETQWNSYSASWGEIQNCCKEWQRSMSWQLQSCPEKIDYDYSSLQALASDIMHTASVIESQVFKKNELLDWNCCEWCWRIAINSKRCPVHADAASDETRKNQRLKRIAMSAEPSISNILCNIYSKMPKINISEPIILKNQIVNLPFVTKYLTDKGVDLDNNRAIIDALDDAGNEEDRGLLHELLFNDYKSRILLAKFEFWHEIGAGRRKTGSGGARAGAGRKKK